MKKIAFTVALTLSIFSLTAQNLNPTSHIWLAGTADDFKGGYTFSYATAGTPWNGSLISYGGFANNYDTQISSDYFRNCISFRTRNGDNNTWNAWTELATKGANDFIGNQTINGYLGVGTTSPLDKLYVYGNHNDSRIVLHSEIGGNEPNQADLVLWASEPWLTYTGVGIGNNVYNFKDGKGGMQLLNPARGGPYIRLLDNYILFNVVSSSGSDKQAVSINNEGNIGIGKINPTNKLDVNGIIHSKEVKVDMNGWSDFVFKREYNLPTLEEVEKHIADKGHLENIPSEEEVLKNGISLGQMNAKLLQKIEELTLYAIEQEKKNNKQSLRIDVLEKENQSFKNVLERLSKIEEKLK